MHACRCSESQLMYEPRLTHAMEPREMFHEEKKNLPSRVHSVKRPPANQRWGRRVQGTRAGRRKPLQRATQTGRWEPKHSTVSYGMGRDKTMQKKMAKERAPWTGLSPPLPCSADAKSSRRLRSHCAAPCAAQQIIFSVCRPPGHTPRPWAMVLLLQPTANCCWHGCYSGHKVCVVCLFCYYYPYLLYS